MAQAPLTIAVVPMTDSHALMKRLVGLPVPTTVLPWTTYASWHDQLGPGANTSLDAIEQKRTLVVYFFPVENARDGYDADTMSRAFRDHDDDFARLGARAVGVSAQTALEQQTIATIELFPQLLLADELLELADALQLPVSEIDGRHQYEPLTLIIRDGVIVHGIYPIGSPKAHIKTVQDWLRDHQKQRQSTGSNENYE
jgi:peroxiredoxin